MLIPTQDFQILALNVELTLIIYQMVGKFVNVLIALKAANYLNVNLSTFIIWVLTARLVGNPIQLKASLTRQQELQINS